MLHTLLADQFALGTMMRHCRWNVTGPQSLRRLSASHQKELDEILDDKESRARAIGNYRTAALTKFLKLVRTKAQPGQSSLASQFTAGLLAGHEAVLCQLRGNLKRGSGPDREMRDKEFFNRMVGKHERMARELQTHVEETNRRLAKRQIKRVEVQEVLCGST